MTPEDAVITLQQAELLVSAAEVQAAMERMARQISEKLRHDHPLVLAVMGGAIVFVGQLLPRLAFPLECDYIHATRYRNSTTGRDLHWVVEPRGAIKGRRVLVLDDILDEGVTLAAIKQRLLEQGAAECLIAVLTEKELEKPKPVRADFVGIRLPNRFVFGCGMDINGFWRNLPEIYAVKEA